MVTLNILVKKLTLINLNRGTGLGCLHPDVLYLNRSKYAKGYSFWLFYTPYPPDEAELPYLARSNNGIVYSYKGVKNPLFMRGSRNEWDSHHIADPDVLIDNNRWLMYYAGAKYVGIKKVVSIGLAMSHDGLIWKKYEYNPVLTADIDNYWEGGSKHVISVSTPTVIKIKNKYYMFYSSKGKDGNSYINLAISSDGIHWKKFEENPVIKPTKEFDGKRVDHPKAVKMEDTLLLFYLGKREDRSVLNVAYAMIDEPYNFIKYEKNPILTAETRAQINVFEEICRMLKINVKIVQRMFRRMCFKLLDNRCNNNYWDSWFIYRSTPLVNETREIVRIKNNLTLLYYSAYNFITGLPSIGIALMKIKLS